MLDHIEPFPQELLEALESPPRIRCCFPREAKRFPLVLRSPLALAEREAKAMRTVKRATRMNDCMLLLVETGR